MTNLDSTLKSRDITLPASSQSYGFSSSPYCESGCVSWTIKKAKRQRMVAFETILKEISPEYSLEGLILKLKLQDFGHLIEELIH